MSSNKTSLVFTGDIGFDRYMDKRWEDKNLLAKPIMDFFHSADHVVANVEGAMINAVDDGSRGVFFHSMNPEAICVLRDMEADIWNISNNHIMDAGREGLVSTREFAASMGSRTIGAGVNEVEASEPVYIDEAGGIGLIGVAYQTECVPATATDPGVFRWTDLDYIAERIKEVKSKCRWCIVVSHGGEEFASIPSPYTRDRYVKFLELGADVVVGHHPHVPENYELFPDGKAIFYSLGNFIFDTNYQRAHLYTDVGVLLKLIFTEDKMEFEAMGTQIIRGEERIVDGPLPDIFTNIDAEEYKLLAPYGAKAFVAEERRKMIYLEPERFTDAPKEVWDAYFFSEEPDGFDKNYHMDFYIMVPFAETAEDGLWKNSKLEKVKEYIAKQL